MRKLVSLLAAGAMSLALSAAPAQSTAPPTDPTGTWTWSYPVASNKVLEAHVTLRLESGRLTGVAVGPDKKELPIENGEFKDGKLRFDVTRLVFGRKFTTRYEGVLDGDRIKGKAGMGPRASTQSQTWEPVRTRPNNPPAP